MDVNKIVPGKALPTLITFIMYFVAAVGAGLNDDGTVTFIITEKSTGNVFTVIRNEDGTPDWKTVLPKKKASWELERFQNQKLKAFLKDPTTDHPHYFIDRDNRVNVRIFKTHLALAPAQRARCAGVGAFSLRSRMTSAELTLDISQRRAAAGICSAYPRSGWQPQIRPAGQRPM